MDTIAALATPALTGPIGVIRLSGPGAAELVGKVFRPRKGVSFALIPDRYLSLGRLTLDGITLDTAMAVKMTAPDSYTGEDMAELHLHGSLPVLNAALEALYRLGARPALAGEFTKLAFLHGKLDLSQAEAVCDLITAQTRDAARNAAGQLDGKLGKQFLGLYDRLSDLLARFYAVMDYPDEALPPAESDECACTLDAAAAELKAMLDGHAWGHVLREGLNCAIIGKPNVGKSSLMNALLGYDRALVTPYPGTTRDTLEESARVGGVLLRLTDSAGMRDTSDPVEALGVDRTRRAAERAELLLVVLDGSAPLDGEDRIVLDMARDRNAVIFINKSDLPQVIETDAVEAAFLHVCRVSALTGDGLNLFDGTLRRMFERSAVCDGSTLTSARQADGVRRTLGAVTASAAALRAGITPDAVLSELESALSALGELTGRRVSDDIVDRIFSKFCIGK